MFDRLVILISDKKNLTKFIKFKRSLKYFIIYRIIKLKFKLKFCKYKIKCYNYKPCFTNIHDAVYNREFLFPLKFLQQQTSFTRPL